MLLDARQLRDLIISRLSSGRFQRFRLPSEGGWFKFFCQLSSYFLACQVSLDAILTDKSVGQFSEWVFRKNKAE
jgi:hypothetical protein